jgi:hypothetical protein
MSQFTSARAVCPSCGTAVPFELVHSVNADRAPELRRRIVDETFQRTTCPGCGNDFRVEPDLNYVEHGRRLWIAALPLERLARWNDAETEAEALFARVYGVRASPFLQALGREMKRRLTFGWAALREKLVIVDLGLDDVTVELCKMAVLRASASAPVGRDAELRLLGADLRNLGFGWLRARDETVVQRLRVRRELYDEIEAGTADAWQALRARLDGMFVDVGRLLHPPEETMARAA